MKSTLLQLMRGSQYAVAFAAIEQQLKRRDISKTCRFDLYCMQSDIYYEKKDFKSSIASTRRALRYKAFARTRNLYKVYVNLGVAYLDLEKEYYAYRSFMKCLMLCPWHPIASRLIGEIFLARDDPYFAMYYLVSAARHRYCRSDRFPLYRNAFSLQITRS